MCNKVKCDKCNNEFVPNIGFVSAEQEINGEIISFCTITCPYCGNVSVIIKDCESLSKIKDDIEQVQKRMKALGAKAKQDDKVSASCLAELERAARLLEGKKAFAKSKIFKIKKRLEKRLNNTRRK